MTAVSPILSGSESSISDERPTSLSDEAEWARENGFGEDLDQRDVERLSQHFIGLG
jgi:hypothetical protein